MEILARTVDATRSYAPVNSPGRQRSQPQRERGDGVTTTTNIDSIDFHPRLGFSECRSQRRCDMDSSWHFASRP